MHRRSKYSSFFTFLLGALGVVPTWAQQPDTCVPAPTGLVSWWPGDGNASDIQGTNQGVYSAGVTFVPGLVDQAFSFQGVDSRVEIADAPNLRPQRFTLAAWIRSDAPSQYGCVVCKQLGTGGDNSYALFLADGILKSYVSTNLGYPLSTGTPVSVGTFVHTATTWDGVLLRLYLDGALVASTTHPGATISYDTNPVLLGADDGGANQFNYLFSGLIDEAAVFDRALTQPEIQAIFDAGVAGQCKRPGEIVSVLDTNHEGWTSATLCFGNVPSPPTILPCCADGCPTDPCQPGPCSPGPCSVTHFSSGGSSGGYISMVDPDGTCTVGQFQYWRAPEAFLGNKSAFVGGELSFALRTSGGSGAYDQEDVLLVGGGLTLVFDLASNPSEDWRSYRVPLIADAGWTIDDIGGTPATAAELETVLSSLEELFIRGEYRAYADIQDLDEVRLTSFDLAVNTVNTFIVDADWQSSVVSMTIAAEIVGVGTGATDRSFTVTFFEDLNFNGRFEIDEDNWLGDVWIDGLGSGATTTAELDVSTVLMFRDNLIHAFVDSGSDIVETDEGNNYGDSRACRETPSQHEPFDMALEWSWPGLDAPSVTASDCLTTPLVVDLDDDGLPEIVFTSYLPGDWAQGGILRAIHGDGSGVYFSVDLTANPELALRGDSPLAIGDMDLDGSPDIVGLGASGRNLICFNADGTTKWISQLVEGGSTSGGNPAYFGGGPTAIAQIDLSTPTHEILYGRQIIDASGNVTLLGSGSIEEGFGNTGYAGRFSVLADLDLDGQLEIIAGNTAYSANGELLWQARTGPDGPLLSDGMNAVANFDDDDFPEIVLVVVGNVFLLDQDGTVIWGPVAIPHSGCNGCPYPDGPRLGPPTVADFDGDGAPEIGIAEPGSYIVLETAGNIRWSYPTSDGSGITGSTVFDFDGDGAAEVVYADEVALYVLDGRGDGVGGTFVRAVFPLSNGTATNMPVVADVDADGQAEIVASANPWRGADQSGIYVFGSPTDTWTPARSIWNQHAYSITNVEDGSEGSGGYPAGIPEVPVFNWLSPPLGAGYNSFRQQRIPGHLPQASPDLTASFIRFSCETEPRYAIARIGNGGALRVDAGVPVSFYGGDPVDGGHLLGTTLTSFPLPPGVFEDIPVALPSSFDCTHHLYAVADDAGGMTGTIEECNEDNNIHGAELNVFSAQLVDTTLDVDIEFTNTTYNAKKQALVVDARLQNIGDSPIDGCLLLTIDVMSDASMSVASPDGLTDDGRPYFVFLDASITPATLFPGEYSGTRKLAFYTERKQPSFEYSFLTCANEPPFFVSFPATSAVFDRGYAYQAEATDPDGHALTYELATAPMSMTIDPISGLIEWLPGMADNGSHLVTIEATDSRGGTAVQRFALEVTPIPPNRPPLFTTTPITHAAVGTSYAYQATVGDPDGDGVSFGALAPAALPDGMTVDPSGLVAWEFTLPGDYSVGIRAMDARGAYADQAYILTVGDVPSNPNSPRLFGTPGSLAVVGQQYLYQPAAHDPDPADVLAFSTPSAPAGMDIDPFSGRLTWRPTADQVGFLFAVVLTVDDGNGGSASQAWDIEVVHNVPNRPPVIESVPSFISIVDVPYAYWVFATDPENTPVTYSLVDSPPGMTIDQDTGVISWTPAISGPVLVAIQATDSQGAFGAQVYDLEVSPPNNPPQINSIPLDSVVVGATYRYQIEAVDPDGHGLSYSLATRPVGMNVGRSTGLVTWTPNAGDIGSHPVEVFVADRYGGSATQLFDVTVTQDTTAPTVAITLSRTVALIDQVTKVCVQGGDDVGIAERMLTADAVQIVLDPAGCAQFVSTLVGLVTFDATASDPAGNVGAATATLQIVDPNDTTTPVITVDDPLPGSIVTGPTDILATISDDTPATLIWEVQMARAGTSDFTTIGQGAGEVLSAPVAMLDPTMLPNDDYIVRITANDGLHTTTVNFPYGVAGDFKLGNFTMSFTDLTIPVAGIPLVVTRTYDSLDTTPGDFGAGWRLALPGNLTDTAADSATSSGMENGAFNPLTRVYVTKPDGSRVGFRFAPQSVGGFFSYLFYPKFEPDPGVQDTLEAVGGPTYVWIAGGEYLDFYVPYNPRTYVLTTKNRVKYTIDEFDGLQLIEDVNGNTIEVRPDGLFSSTGVALLFERDTQGRITKVIEPDADPTDGIAPGELNYSYDATGNLIAFADQLANTTNYFYEDARFPNYLTRIEDPLNRPMVRSVFDDTGRLIGICDANGDPATLAGCTSFTNDAVADTATIINARGFRTDLFFDERGNVLTERRWLDDATFLETVRTYDAEDNLLTVTDPEFNTWSFTYDSRGNPLTRTDPGDRTFTSTYNACNAVETVTDPMGNVTAYDYDEFCNLLLVTDALGGVTEYRYNALGQPTDFIDALGNLRHTVYDSSGFPAGFTDPLGNSATLEFDSRGQFIDSIDRKGWRIGFEYDDAHRVTTEIWYDPADGLTPVRVIDYGHNAGGQITSAIDQDSALTMTYLPTGELESVDNVGTPGAPNVVISYTYDANGNVASVTDSLGGITEYIYDGLDRLVRVQQSGMGVNEKRVDFVVDGANLLREAHRFADLAGTLPVANTFYEYDCSGCPSRVASIHHRNASDTSVIHDMDFVRDALGNILQMTDAEGVHTYAYDGLRRLLTATHPVGGVQPDEFYSYDSVGNRRSSHLSASHVYSYEMGLGGVQIRQDDQLDYTYDTAGNVATQTDRITGERTEFMYNHRGRMVALAKFGVGQAVPFLTATYFYDAANRRIRMDEAGAVKQFAYDGQNPVLKLSVGGAIASRRMYARGIDAIWGDETSGQTRWFLTDQIGTIRSIVSNSGILLNGYIYDSFGRSMFEAAPAVHNDIRFTAREFSDVTGAGYLRARFYDPPRGRFVSEDPREPFAYDYSAGNPLAFTDPTGELSVADTVLVVSTIGLAALIWDLYGIGDMLSTALNAGIDPNAEAICKSNNPGGNCKR